ncbi:CaiB/BaiF CoA-transferase family protein [Piscinibacter sakaiensis]|uniref:Alpha-methylacyl-CoA racemase n=1 Tax=Piscinibacter sakaiensis TaxID=1547922 RepID=A0A0K8P6A9_PISS1|nr:CaiB/BaiF CoA-transferase family protein [Piscinibacter sakaiensis]GAP38136.1 alpha-methylacyl-CoA racemase [Piscinibacter sakaiensis]
MSDDASSRDSRDLPPAGPLRGIRIVEFAAIGPAPYAGQLLAELGADIIRIDRAERAGQKPGILSRGRRSVALDLKQPAAIETCLSLLERADACTEGFRPGVMERLGLGPETALARNPKLVYTRMTGWGQTGPLAQAAGHDLNYISLSGAAHAIGSPEAPVPPLNLVGDFGGGSLFLAMGLLAGVLNARATGAGQVVDVSMVEGSASLMSMFYEMQAGGRWGGRGTNLVDGGAPFYGPYRCADGKWISLGSIEPQFYALMLDRLGLRERLASVDQNDRSQWPATRRIVAEAVATRTRDEWCAAMEGSDVCFAPVLDLAEAPAHPHNVARGSFVEADGKLVPGPAPRFLSTPGRTARAPSSIGADTLSALADWGVAAPAC